MRIGMAPATLLIEIGTEELPPKQLDKLSATFAQSIERSLNELGFMTAGVEHFVTPRRIAARLKEVPAIQPTRLVQKRGPALSAAYDAQGNPTPAALGFARSCGVEFTALKKLETPQGTWLIFEQEQSGKKLSELLAPIIEKALHEIPGKRMRWGQGEVEFLRPLHWLTVIHGDQGLPIVACGLTATTSTHGHRFHAPQAIAISHADNYVTVLHEAKVIADPKRREQEIKKGITALAELHGGQAIIEDELLDQVAGLVEWPVPLSAQFDERFLAVPQEALISSMQHHQKCFAIQDPQGKLLPTFILVSNTQAEPLNNIIRGNERVMQARLADAKFFYDQDRKTPLFTRLEGLKNMVFQKKLGTLYEKSHRIAKLATAIAKQLELPTHLCERAGKLCKADLLTEMVYEFPELQGTMGYYYALNDGEPEEVALAIKESYLPRFAKDALPSSSLGICLALADRLDTLVGIFGIGQLPSGDKDPFGLRRQALAIVRILIEKALPLDLENLCQLARHGYGILVNDEVISQIVVFCFERFKAWYQEQGVSAQTLDAVMANRPTQPYDCSRRALAVNHFQTLNEAQNLAAANKRVRNILQKSGIVFNGQQMPLVDATLLKEEAEKNLAFAIDNLKIKTQPLILAGKYQEALIQLAQLQQPVDQFFDQVMVMTDDETIKKNRLNLLGNLSALFMQIADISKLAL